MDDHVMDKCIHQAVGGGADPNRHEYLSSRDIESNRQEGDDGDSEENRIQIVEFETRGACSKCTAMVTAVQGDPETMHHPAMERIRDWLHGHERDAAHHHTVHGAYGSRCQADYRDADQRSDCGRGRS